MKKTALIIINEQHSLFEQQQVMIDNMFDEFDFIAVPSTGWSLMEINQKVVEIVKTVHMGLAHEEQIHVIFASPIPVMIKQLVVALGNPDYRYVRIFHNDNRDKKELPNGNVIQVVSKTGWQLV